MFAATDRNEYLLDAMWIWLYQIALRWCCCYCLWQLSSFFCPFNILCYSFRRRQNLTLFPRHHCGYMQHSDFCGFSLCRQRSESVNDGKDWNTKGYKVNNFLHWMKFNLNGFFLCCFYSDLSRIWGAFAYETNLKVLIFLSLN